MSLRVMAFGHCYMDELPRRKWAALRSLHSDVEICVVTPREWPDAFRTLTSRPVSSERLSFVPFETFFSGYGSRYFYRPGQLPRLVSTFGPDIIHVDHEPWSVAYTQISRVADRYAPNARRVVFSWWNVPRPVPFPWSVVHRRVLARTDLIIAGNHRTEATHRTHGFRGPVVVMPQLGVDLQEFQPKPREAPRAFDHDRPCVIGFIGRLIPGKAVDLLVAALRDLAHLPWTLLIVGSGPEQPRLEHLSSELGIGSRVQFVGAVQQREVGLWMRRFDVLVLPSTREWNEQFGHVLVEAMACGVAVVGSDSGEIPHVIDDSGFVFPAGDRAALAAILEQMIRNPALATTMSRRGLQRAISLFSDEAVAAQLIAAYRELVAEADGRSRVA